MRTDTSYVDRLEESRRTSGSILCLGIDPVPECLPAEFTGTLATRIINFYREVFRIAKERKAVPGAFKANIGFFHALDRPRAKDFSGSNALARLLELLNEEFPGVPVILDAKRGDIARSSTNYGTEAFRAWQVDAVTVSPYMGDDSVLSIAEEARRAGGLLYVLAATSNPGAKRFQGLTTDAGSALAVEVGRAVVEWHAESACCGAVVGATHAGELAALLELFASDGVPVLIPGVGSQGGSVESVLGALRGAGYPISRARINVSSAITHPWRTAGAPADRRTVEAPVEHRGAAGGQRVDGPVEHRGRAGGPTVGASVERRGPAGRRTVGDPADRRTEDASMDRRTVEAPVDGPVEHRGPAGRRTVEAPVDAQTVGAPPDWRTVVGTALEAYHRSMR